jgi:hypothetical protein
MEITALILAAVGAACGVASALWLYFGFKPDNPRYTRSGPLYPGEFETPVVANLLTDQQKPIGLAVFGSTLQLLAAFLTVLAQN